MEYIIAFLTIIGFIYLISRFAKRPSNNFNTDAGGFREYIEDKSLTKKAFKHFQVGNYEDAIIETDNIIEHHDNFTKIAYDIRAMSLECLGYNLDAIYNFSQSLVMDPNDANIYYLRGLAKQKIGQYTEAKKDLKKAVELKQNMQLYQQALGTLETITMYPQMEEQAKEKAKEEGKLIKRTKTSTKTKASELNQKEFQEGMLTSLEKLREHAYAEPANEELQKLLRDSEARYMNEFVYGQKNK